MSADRIYLSKDEQNFLTSMLEIADPQSAVEKFATLLIEERADPSELQGYLKEIMKVDLEAYYFKLKGKK